MLLKYFNILLFHSDVIYFEKSSSLSCSKVSLKYDTATWMLHSFDGVFRLVCFRLFLPNLAMVIVAKQFHFSLSLCSLSGLSQYMTCFSENINSYISWHLHEVLSIGSQDETFFTKAPSSLGQITSLLPVWHRDWTIFYFTQILTASLFFFIHTCSIYKCFHWVGSEFKQ